jgi:hypothetical protein
VHQYWYKPTRIDAQKPGFDVLIGQQIDGMRLLVDPLEIKEDPHFLRARRSHVVDHMDAVPVEHLTPLDMNHVYHRSLELAVSGALS